MLFCHFSNVFPALHGRGLHASRVLKVTQVPFFPRKSAGRWNNYRTIVELSAWPQSAIFSCAPQVCDHPGWHIKTKFS